MLVSIRFVYYNKPNQRTATNHNHRSMNVDNSIIKSNDSPQEALEKIRAILDTANKTVLDNMACQHTST